MRPSNGDETWRFPAVVTAGSLVSVLLALDVLLMFVDAPPLASRAAVALALVCAAVTGILIGPTLGRRRMPERRR